MSKKEGKPPGDTTALYRELQTHKDKEDFEKALKVYLNRNTFGLLVESEVAGFFFNSHLRMMCYFRLGEG